MEQITENKINLSEDEREGRRLEDKEASKTASRCLASALYRQPGSFFHFKSYN